MSLQMLTVMSNKYGADENFVLAGGGNTSFKDNGVMAVKTSGTQLATIKAEEFVKMDMNPLTAMLNKDYPKDDDAREAAALADMMATRLPGEEAKRPSVEAILHAMFPQKFVLHTHPALINGMTCGKSGEAMCREMFGDSAVWVPLTKPGYVLATVCKRLFAEAEAKIGKHPQIVILQNHGIFVAADTVGEIDAIMNDVVAKFNSKIASKPDFSPVEFAVDKIVEILPAVRMLYSPEGKAVTAFCANKQVVDFLSDEKKFASLAKPFSPDHIVYCKDEPLLIAAGDDIAKAFESYSARKGFSPKIIAVKNVGFISVGSTKKEAETAKTLFLDAVKVATYAASFGGALHLPDDFTKFILDWEVEQYRIAAAFVDSGAKRLDGKIAIVTGSAQGFGKGIAEELTKQGAYVVIADINADGAAKFSAELNEKYGAYCSIAFVADVTNEDSIAKMVDDTVVNFGGLDLFVANAGVSFPGPIFEISNDKFDLITKVNYTGYFLCAKHAARVMSVQNSFASGYLTDIVEINSKSGLVGSNKNSAYAGSKFGGIGLTQSFALEFVEFGIKVNAVCPGNYLDGPLWADPEKGLFKQFLEAGKVKGAKDIADVRKHYESLVPLKRGCDPVDVARAIFYAVEQKYETGQAIPVSGGQVMLS